MIKLDLPSKPLKLTDELIEKLTNKYLVDESDVWNRKFIREAILKFSFGKCCYTECKLDEESKFMEVDHFFPKKHFPKKVLNWGNLLPSCKKSNTTKGELDTYTTPIINPTKDNPKDHLYIEGYRFYGKTEIGKRTITYTALNDRKHFVNKRYNIGIKIIEMLEEIHSELSEKFSNTKKNQDTIVNTINKYKNLLNEGNRIEEYSATIATIILNSDYNNLIINLIESNSLWDSELEDCKSELLFCSLCK